MMQGDSYRVEFELLHEDKTPIPPAELAEIEVCIGGIRKLLSAGDIDFDENEGEYYVRLTQQETFRFRGDVHVQARPRFLSGDVIGLKLGTINVEESDSKVVL